MTNPGMRQARDRRRRRHAHELTTRDEALLRALVRFRLARTSDLRRLLFGSIRLDTCSVRLRKLFDAGFVDVRVGDRAKENLYHLGPKGRTWAREQGLRVGRAPSGWPEHHLAIVRVWSELAAGMHASAGLRLRRFLADPEIRESRSGGEPWLIPDAWVEFTVDLPEQPGSLVRFALEVDRRTERPPVLRRKLEQYERLRLAGEGPWGQQGFGLVFVLECGGLARLRTVENLLQEQWGSWSVALSGREQCQVLIDRVLGAAGVPLTATPCRKGPSGEASNGRIASCEAEGTGP